MNMWESLDKQSRIGIAVGVTVLVIATVVALSFVLSSGKSALFSGLDDKEAANVITALEDMKVPYELQNGGKDILVDKNIAEQTRLKLIGQGVKVQTGQGFELFDDADIGMTEYSQKINYLRALQGELTRSITAIDGIKYARVHLVLPETSVFKQKKQPPTASVTVIPDPGKSLDSEQIKGIQRMVSSAAPGLEQANVTILDNRGVTLSSTQYEEDNQQVTSLLLKKKREAEAYFEAKVKSVLDKAVGEGNSVATISVELLLDKIHRKEEIVLPHKSVNDGLKRKRETTSADSKQQSKNKNQTVELEYQLNKRIEEIIQMPGAIGRISVGVLVPENTDLQKVEQLRKIIALSVGMDLDRGDDVAVYPMSMGAIEKVQVSEVTDSLVATSSVTVESDQFADEALSVESSSWPEYLTLNNLIYVSVALFMVIIALLLMMMGQKSRARRNQQQELSLQQKEKLLSDLKLIINESAA